MSNPVRKLNVDRHSLARPQTRTDSSAMRRLVRRELIDNLVDYVDTEVLLSDPAFLTLERLVTYQRLKGEPAVTIEQASEYLVERQADAAVIDNSFLHELTKPELRELRVFTEWLGGKLSEGS